MTFSELGQGLNNITVKGSTLKFAHFGWASAPAGDYGVYSESGADQFQADNRFGEHYTIGYINYFTRDDSEAAKNAIEDYLRQVQETNVCAWYLNTIQYEENTHFIHYEWVVEVA